MGLVEVLRHLPRLRGLFQALLDLAREEAADGALLIDYPGFNLRLAGALRAQQPGTRLFQYVCPQVWAWKKGRVPQIGNTFDALYCLFDFEPALFEGFPVEARWVGHPLAESVRPELDRESFFHEAGLDPGIPVVALLPGSRAGEIARLVPPLADLVRLWEADPSRPRVQWVLPLAPTVGRAEVQRRLGTAPVRVLEGRTYSALAHAAAALVASGTATLEAALLGVPFALIYRLSPLTYLAGRMLVKVPFVGLPNIVAGREIVPELIQGEVEAPKLAAHLAQLLEPGTSARMRAELAGLRPRLGAPGAARRVAEHLLDRLDSRR
ncbi:MAG: lipid-A-disaccharide synthase [Acidobacteria bacterium]|nr:lipid-A-disaccharide synthase [Acidobacteriota bacterium]